MAYLYIIDVKNQIYIKELKKQTKWDIIAEKCLKELCEKEKIKNVKSKNLKTSKELNSDEENNTWIFN